MDKKLEKEYKTLLQKKEKLESQKNSIESELKLVEQNLKPLIDLKKMEESMKQKLEAEQRKLLDSLCQKDNENTSMNGEEVINND